MHPSCTVFFFFNDTATTEIYTLSLHDALPISAGDGAVGLEPAGVTTPRADLRKRARGRGRLAGAVAAPAGHRAVGPEPAAVAIPRAQLGERARRRRRLPELRLAPAGDEAGGPGPGAV